MFKNPRNHIKLIHLINYSLYNHTTITIDKGISLSREMRTTQGIRQECSVSRSHKNTKKENMFRIMIDHHTCLNTILYANDQVLIQKIISKDRYISQIS